MIALKIDKMFEQSTKWNARSAISHARRPQNSAKRHSTVRVVSNMHEHPYIFFTLFQNVQLRNRTVVSFPHNSARGAYPLQLRSPGKSRLCKILSCTMLACAPSPPLVHDGIVYLSMHSQYGLLIEWAILRKNTSESCIGALPV